VFPRRCFSRSSLKHEQPIFDPEGSPYVIIFYIKSQDIIVRKTRRRAGKSLLTQCKIETFSRSVFRSCFMSLYEHREKIYHTKIECKQAARCLSISYEITTGISEFISFPVVIILNFSFQKKIHLLDLIQSKIIIKCLSLQ